jgi:hypothetical protein
MSKLEIDFRFFNNNNNNNNNRRVSSSSSSPVIGYNQWYDITRSSSRTTNITLGAASYPVALFWWWFRDWQRRGCSRSFSATRRGASAWCNPLALSWYQYRWWSSRSYSGAPIALPPALPIALPPVLPSASQPDGEIDLSIAARDLCKTFAPARTKTRQLDPPLNWRISVTKVEAWYQLTKELQQEEKKKWTELRRRISKRESPEWHKKNKIGLQLKPPLQYLAGLAAARIIVGDRKLHKKNQKGFSPQGWLEMRRNGAR